LIEAKFTSLNAFYEGGPRADGRSLSKAGRLRIYQNAALRVLDLERAEATDHVYYELSRKLIFAEWMALADRPATRAYDASLTCSGFEAESRARSRGWSARSTPGDWSTSRGTRLSSR
jgi:hypothetical protein